MARIGDLPEDLLLDILSLVPMKDLVLSCRQVSTRWRDLVDLPVLWKRIYRRKSDNREKHESKAAFIFSHLEKNLIKNPCGEEGLDSWEIKNPSVLSLERLPSFVYKTPPEVQWKVRELSAADSATLQMKDYLQRNSYVKNGKIPVQRVKKCFIAYDGLCVKAQRITLKDEGYWDELMDEGRPTIVVKDRFYNSRGFHYQMSVKLLSADSEVLRERDSYQPCLWNTPPFATIPSLRKNTKRTFQTALGQWCEALFTFYNCPPGVRHILFEHEGSNRNPQKYGGRVRITQSSITLGPHPCERDLDIDALKLHWLERGCKANPWCVEPKLSDITLGPHHWEESYDDDYDDYHSDPDSNSSDDFWNNYWRPFQSPMGSIGDLPEDILIDVLCLLPAREIVCTCRLVCLLWRDLVELPSLWKRKCQREGYHPQAVDKSVQDWRIFYFLCSLKRNLIKNPCAEEGFESWEIESNGGDLWKVEDLPGEHGREFPHPHIQKYFVTSYGSCLKNQLVTLKDHGYWDQLMDEVKPDIVVKDWYAARHDCGCRYQLSVKLLSADYIVLQEFLPKDVVIEQWSDAEWREVSYTFHNYPPGVRHILFHHGGQDTQFWAGWYGVRVTNSSITIGPEVAG
ncbi:uncharacterized protein LOC133372839 [Rhineura floridana]|uniref:uncharacterized protein LOC133372839 n=1 Tax=Rhineura floridana TaxID=261503 RepID=UPI002AC871CE|nr:uncharacterized protein LOC133372839 [Rhineura floridana]